MASTLLDNSSSSSSGGGGGGGYINKLEQARQDFWSSHAQLSEEQRQALWIQAASAPASNVYHSPRPSMASQTPRTMRHSMPNVTDFSPANFGYMDRTHSAPGMAHQGSAVGLDSTELERCTTTFSDWQSMPQEPTNDYALFSESSVRNQAALQPIDEAACFANEQSMVEYSPNDYVSNCIEPMTSNSLFTPIPQHSQQQGQLTPNQWCSSSDASTSPSTPVTALMTPVTQSSDMSRQGSYNPNFVDNVSMLRVHSASSCALPILHEEDGSFPFSFDAESKPISIAADGSQFSHFTGYSEGFLSSSVNPVSASAHGLASIDNKQSDLAEDMRRSTSISSSESSMSDGSMPSSIYSRHSRREREINAQAASRKIAPKAVELIDETESMTSNAQMARIRSEDGSSKTVGLLSKTPYVRPSHPKIMCSFCNERPDGFRGTHELERHVARAHAPSRKGYICIDASTDGKFLANCKHCRNKKVYGAYYNAAAHLRRAHFHPRKRGRKGKNDEKRGGIGGGDDPPMEYLKQNWIREVEVDNKPSPPSPQSAGDEAPEQFDFNAPHPIDASTAYPQQQMSSSMPTQVQMDPSQFIGYGMSMNASEPMMMYDNTAFPHFDPTIVVPNDISNFQFDADASY
ncbi:hypothetical protein T440DRAFT_554899 [Plenodomus tracheiphilus IPT5]|uniref:DUF7896 domain-containing protein n=1 Tax=Plenodomus tracheiphilus IPT5 TaxID=1408161 RepID=A0A6A7B8M0_9PLEO|nr:hypothetical protein T440DRAFT_554899 [Plenodomus tracheiphilus IPT5]